MAGVPTVGSKTGTATASADVFGGMGPDMFLKLLVAQLQYQNPMSPSDPTAMLSQVSQYAQVEALNKLQTLQANGNALTEAQTATDAIGQQVTAIDGSGAELKGMVTAARFTDAGPILVLDTGAEVSLSAVASIGKAPTPATTTPATTPPAATTPAATTPTPAATTPAITTPATTTTPATPAPTTPSTTDSGATPVAPAA